ncbi:hypothetical protein JW766_01750 [Candidatus Dojkabacteria bacterium]|nr:hypothetical protein [Candidatus Dojkabacteria bacterium]
MTEQRTELRNMVVSSFVDQEPSSQDQLEALVVGHAICEQVIYEAVECLEKGISTPAAQAVVDTALATLNMHPAIPLEAPMVISRMLEANRMRYELKAITSNRFPLVPGSLLISGAGSIYSESWTATHFEIPGSKERIIEYFNMILRVGFVAYFDLAWNLAIQRGFPLPPYPPDRLSRGNVMIETIPQRVHLADPIWPEYLVNPNLAVYFFPPSLIECLAGITRGSILEDAELSSMTLGGFITADTHQSLCAFYPPNTFEELEIFRLDPNSFIPNSEESGVEQARSALLELSKLISLVQENGRVLFTIGSGNDKHGMFQRYTLMGILKYILESTRTEHIFRSSPNPEKKYFLSAIRPDKPLKRPSWAPIGSSQWREAVGRGFRSRNSLQMTMFVVTTEFHEFVRQLIADAEGFSKLYASRKDEAVRMSHRLVGVKYRQKPSNPKKGRKKKGK